MKKCKIGFLIAPLLLSSCITRAEIKRSVAPFESKTPSSSAFSSSVAGSVDFGSDPTCIYQRENAPFTKGVAQNPYRVSTFFSSGSGLLWGPQFLFSVEECWIDVELVGQKDMTAGVKGPSSLVPEHAYRDRDNVVLDGREFPGVSGYWGLNAYIPQEACQNPDECFIRVISHPTDNLKAIIGCSLLVVYPFGEPVEATSEEAGVSNAESRGITGPVWLNWKAEEVAGGVSFPKIEGLYQNIDINRVNAALDIMYENARGRYFTKAS